MATTSSKKPPKPTLLVSGEVSEKYIQSEILSWLKQTGMLHWRQNSGTVFIGKRMIKLGESGLPDIVVIVPPAGRLLALECKSAKGKLRPDQVLFREKALKVGAYFNVVRSLQEAQQAVAAALGEERWTDKR